MIPHISPLFAYEMNTYLRIRYENIGGSIIFKFLSYIRIFFLKKILIIVMKKITSMTPRRANSIL